MRSLARLLTRARTELGAPRVAVELLGGALVLSIAAVGLAMAMAAFV